MTIIGAPFLTYIGAMLHPTRVLWHGSPWLFIGVHLVWPFLVAGLALMLVQLVSDIDEAPARITRLLVIPMVIAFTLYTTYSGVAIGAIVWEGNRFPIARREPISDLIDYLTTNTLATTLRITAELLWAACAITARPSISPPVMSVCSSSSAATTTCCYRSCCICTFSSS